MTAGAYNVTMKATDAAGYQATAVLAIAIAAATCTSCPGPGITTTSLPQAGGLSSYFTPTNGANLLSNPGFESGWTGWKNGQSGASSFKIDSSLHHSGSASVNM